MSSKNETLANKILENVGGKDNIVSSTHCATRLRLVLKRSLPDAKKNVSNKIYYNCTGTICKVGYNIID